MPSIHPASPWPTCLASIVVLQLCSCQTAPPIASPPPPNYSDAVPLPAGDYTYGTAIVESVNAEPLTAGPTRAQLTIRGLLNDGATTIHQVEQTKTPDGFVITITTARLKSAVATLALVPFERIVTLDLSAVRSGPCQIRVNDVRTTIMVP
ncbi:hypothetical protein FEM03_14725 [Phragmitibacter flavus]|uniref:Uncharacterized protein n=1 Tax=Phragmitibacter flavus TaxID=2576071 RepID=A0A5R8KCD6_9BACT|nr:hypothetical protein [Phragmitibacter flavus]TLD69983.1 hypothetical protein FEM03_14725 [Phragmitibacter flavus]